MSKIADERSVNSPADWALMIPMAVIGAVSAVVYGVACMVKWAANMAFKGESGVRSERR